MRPTATLNASRRRGSIYLATLGAMMLTVVLGVGGLLASRSAIRSTWLHTQTDQASLLASAGLELGLQRLADDANWRSTHSGGHWTALEDVPGGQVRFLVTDPGDDSLTDSTTDQALLTAEGHAGDAVQRASIRLQVDPVTLQLQPVTGTWRRELIP
jgi:type II secretory pathway component PulK